MNNNYLISCQKIKDNSPLYLTIEDSIIENCILLSQCELERILGTKLIERLYAELPMTGSTNVYYTLNTEYCQYYLLYSTIKHCINSIHFKASNQGLVTKESPDYQAVDLNNLKYFVGLYTDYSSIFAEKIVKHLCAHSTDYPEYLTNTGYDEIQPSFKDQIRSPFMRIDRKTPYEKNNYGYGDMPK